jgi:hypothetical protein
VDQKRSRSRQEETAITRISVAGFKSISQEQAIEIRPLTILAGANSSGKSSMMQPLLLLKQTLEETYDPGALLLYGPNVKFTSLNQLLSRVGRGKTSDTLVFGISVGSGLTLTLFLHRQPTGGIDVQCMSYLDGGETTSLQLGMTHEEILSAVPPRDRELLEKVPKEIRGENSELIVVRDRCFLEITFKSGDEQIRFRSNIRSVSPGLVIEPYIRRVIHLPGLRGNPERTYPVAAVGLTFPGTFEKYFASVIAQWQTEKDRDKLEQLSKDLEKLSLTWKVTARPINDTQVELQVGRLKGRTRDLVSIADVGLGVSQTLPVLVALQVAEPKQLVYLEHPELHLHSRAQFVMAQILANAANRGVRVVVETHSSLLLLGVQALVAEGKLAPEKVKLHWFKRDDNGNTKVSSADLDEMGAFGDWPEDFADVALEAESRYLDAAGAWGRKNGYGGKKVETPRH